jgi:hypothetical protein
MSFRDLSTNKMTFFGFYENIHVNEKGKIAIPGRLYDIVKKENVKGFRVEVENQCIYLCPDKKSKLKQTRQEIWFNGNTLAEAGIDRVVHVMGFYSKILIVSPTNFKKQIKYLLKKNEQEIADYCKEYYPDSAADSEQ